jgi:protein-S-isoprenylcysteine O-methyltransferase Ste14
VKDIPGAILTATIWTYWFGIAAMVVRSRRGAHRLGGLVPEQPVERMMWVVWVPLVATWTVLPYLALVRRTSWLRPSSFAIEEPAYAALRWAAAGCAVLCLVMTVWCWARMDHDWSMAVSEEHKGELITDGLFAVVRHPIYALSILLMICTAVIVATLPMLMVAAVHINLLCLKARNEERHLLKMHGDAYARYLRHTRRFIPRLGARGS